ncbi:hypothetical protein PsYK624_061170 [Phanerochaete sordida]|uniref:Uncharacterized protein n=1 Tax=Phanerochaete sordida TaxID=48140 RepID=A0A9P3LDJ5_9APHY|nr:hypothetical protein PsYK624_061170 [Phanerochaete sordida]
MSSSDDPGLPTIAWTRPAEDDLEQLPDDPRYEGDKKGWHERLVRSFAREHVPEADKARIRKPAHSGGQNPREPEHITVTFKVGNRDIRIEHVYTGWS